MTLPEPKEGGPVAFKVLERADHAILWFWIGVDGWLEAGDLASIRLPDEIPEGKGVAFAGIGPTWLYCHLTRLVRTAGAFPWAGTFEPRLCRTIVVWTSDPDECPIGCVVPGSDEAPDMAVTPGRTHDPRRSARQHAVAVVGPPHSGKSVLVAGFQRLLRRVPRTWVYRATPDGEGLWSQETAAEHAQQIRRKHNWTDRFCHWNLAGVQLLKKTCDLLFVDTGGRMSTDTADLVRLCGKAAILVSTRAEQEHPGILAQWRSFCQDARAQVVAELVSDLDASESMVRADEGLVTATVAGLDRSNPQPEQEVAPVLKAIMARLKLSDLA